MSALVGRRGNVCYWTALLSILSTSCVDLTPPRGLEGMGPGDGAPAEVASEVGGEVATDVALPDRGAGIDAATGDGAVEMAAAVDASADTSSAVDAASDPTGATDASTPDLATDAPAPKGTPCTAGGQCQTGMCIEGVCCDSPCTQACHSCRVAGSQGSCVPVPSGMDLRGECSVQDVSTCGRAGGCNGGGACLMYPPGMVCSPQMCSAGVQNAARTCSGGTCVAGAATDCAPFVCGPTSCLTSCPGPADCQPGTTCSGNACIIPGLVLHWRFDEANGTAAADASGSGYTGTYTGATGTPTPSPLTPAGLKFPNPQSRAFVLADRHAVQLAPIPPALKFTNNVTISAWYRLTALDTGGSEIISAGDQYSVRVSAGYVEMSKRIAGAHRQCRASPTGFIDDNWHHIAGLTTPAGMKLYIDGVERCTDTVGDDIVYDRGPDFWVGRHGNAGTIYDFGGNIDDVRVYNRALSAAEVANLAKGAR